MRCFNCGVDNKWHLWGWCPFVLILLLLIALSFGVCVYIAESMPR